MAKTSRRKGRTTESGPFTTGQEEVLQSRRDDRDDRTDKKPGQGRERL